MYHIYLRRLFSAKRYGLIGLIYRIRIEEDAARLKYYRLDMGQRLRRNKNYVRIRNILVHFGQMIVNILHWSLFSDS